MGVLEKKGFEYSAGQQVVDVLGVELDFESVSPNPTNFPQWLTYYLKRLSWAGENLKTVRCPCGYTKFSCMRCEQVFYINNDIKAHLLKEHHLTGEKGYSDSQKRQIVYYKEINHYCDFESKSYTNLLRHLLDAHKKQEWVGVARVNDPLVRMSYITGIVNCLVVWEKFKSPRAIGQLHRYFDIPLRNLEQLFGNMVFRIEFDVSPRVEKLLHGLG